MSKEMSRRSFLKTGTAVAAGIAVAPNIIIAGEKTPKKEKKKKVAPSDKLNILGVGIGGRGAADLAEMETENIIGLCDVDWKYADHVFNKYPQAKKYNDYRVMYDELLDKADAVMIATADHTHAIIARSVKQSILLTSLNVFQSSNLGPTPSSPPRQWQPESTFTSRSLSRLPSMRQGF